VDHTTNPFSAVPEPKRVSAAEVRVGDAERQDAASQLQDHFAAGRLTWDELDERLGVAWAARTAGELSALFTDLPVQRQTTSPAEQPKAVMARRRLPHFHPVFALVLAFAVFAAIATHGWVLFPLVWILVIGGMRGRHFGPPRGPRYGQHGHYRR
jgi:hypothetical protein